MAGSRTTVAAAFSAVAAAAVLASCGSDELGRPKPSQGDLVPQAVAQEVRTGKLVAGLNQFGLKYLQLLTGGAPDENVVFSPLSIGMAFGMAEAGARGETAEQIAEILGFPSSGEGLHTAFSKLDRKLSDSQASTVRLVNRMYPRIAFPLVEDFVKTLADDYDAPLERLDFASDPEGSRQRINDWVAARTADRIEELLAPGFIDPDTVLILVNALYLEAMWSQPFGKEATEPAPFARLDGSTVDAPLMHNPELRTRFLDSPGLQAVELPYGKGELSMLVLVPENGSFAEFERGLDAAALSRIDERMKEGFVDLALPRWRARFEIDLVETLRGLGLTVPFDTGAADFTGISPENPWIGRAVHAADIEVDEHGTIAAAATALGFRVCLCPKPPTTAIRADRPFVYLIRDTETGTVLFAGRVVDPTV